MNLVGLMLVRNEDWILALSARVALEWCDAIVILDHASDDNTPEIILDLKTQYGNRILWLQEHDPIWREMKYRQRMLEAARKLGATHIALVDADEVLTGNLLPTIRQRIEALNTGCVMNVGMLAMWRGLREYRVGDSIWANRHDLSLAFKDHQQLHWTAVNGYDHHHRAPYNSRPQNLGRIEGGVMHLQWASWRRLKAKHARYKMDERLKYPGKPREQIDKLYSLALDERDIQLAAAPPEWWEPWHKWMRYVDLEAKPWQEMQCQQWMADHGKDKFLGLDLFGVC